MEASIRLSRGDWAKASTFHPLSGPEVLATVEGRVDRSIHEGRRPVVVFDMDGTLYENRPRTIRILEEWWALEGRRSAEPAIAKLDPDAHFFTPTEALSALALAADRLAHAEAYWAPRFFSSEYLHLDRAYPGAAQLVQALHGRGANVAYLTGRDEPRMGQGTRAALARDGFPVGPGVHFLLKPDPEHADAEHKAAAIEALRSLEVVACFDNEPHHLIAVQTVLPDAMHVFCQTIASPTPAPPGKGLYRLEGLERGAYQDRPSL